MSTLIVTCATNEDSLPIRQHIVDSWRLQHGVQSGLARRDGVLVGGYGGRGQKPLGQGEPTSLKNRRGEGDETKSSQSINPKLGKHSCFRVILGCVRCYDNATAHAAPSHPAQKSTLTPFSGGPVAHGDGPLHRRQLVLRRARPRKRLGRRVWSRQPRQRHTALRGDCGN